jgi:hypothetical protein
LIRQFEINVLNRLELSGSILVDYHDFSALEEYGHKLVVKGELYIHDWRLE